MEISSVMSPKEETAFTNGKLESSSSGQQNVKADLLSTEAPNDNKSNTISSSTASSVQLLQPNQMLVTERHDKMEVKSIRTGMYLEAAEGFDRETCMNCKFCKIRARPSSSEHPSMMMDLSAFKPLPMPRSELFTSSLLLMPVHKLEIFESLPHIPHFREVWKCPPEFREGTALGLMLSMQIEDDARVYQQKMSSLLDLEENGFLVGPLMVRLNNLLSTRNRQIDLKNKKASLEKEILEIEATNCSLEQQGKILDMCIMAMEEQKYQEMKSFIDTQKAANCSSISKLQACLHQVDELVAAADADFCSIAAAPWQQSEVGSSQAQPFSAVTYQGR
ncbi:hypothetical protein HU200_036221 [Digitaria exilis]|uniref:Uncharacterized protein n=1 Tax=Digitaria exilis TaxID=1010633 RepID=A0A835BFH4_9POAL|nr:hypothetical protein HU200_036221 [Digitaria exilis]